MSKEQKPLSSLKLFPLKIQEGKNIVTSVYHSVYTSKITGATMKFETTSCKQLTMKNK